MHTKAFEGINAPPGKRRPIYTQAIKANDIEKSIIKVRVAERLEKALIRLTLRSR
ncbi:MAG: hypothetical protein P8Z71_01190 [Candidatus Sulfobium sp.]|jgi:hypothetical protein